MSSNTIDPELIVDLWSTIKSYIPVKDQKSAVIQFITTIDDTGMVDIALYHLDMYGFCDVFDVGLKIYCEENELIDAQFEDWDE